MGKLRNQWFIGWIAVLAVGLTLVFQNCGSPTAFEQSASIDTETLDIVPTATPRITTPTPRPPTPNEPTPIPGCILRGEVPEYIQGIAIGTTMVGKIGCEGESPTIGYSQSFCTQNPGTCVGCSTDFVNLRCDINSNWVPY